MESGDKRRKVKMKQQETVGDNAQRSMISLALCMLGLKN